MHMSISFSKICGTKMTIFFSFVMMIIVVVRLEIVTEVSWLRFEEAVLILKWGWAAALQPSVTSPCICIGASQKTILWFHLTVGITSSIERILCAYIWQSNLFRLGFWSAEKLFVNLSYLFNFMGYFQASCNSLHFLLSLSWF